MSGIGETIGVALLALETITSLTGRLIDVARRTKELTPEEAETFRLQIEAAFRSARWKTDAQLKADAVVEGGAKLDGSQAALPTL